MLPSRLVARSVFSALVALALVSSRAEASTIDFTNSATWGGADGVAIYSKVVGGITVTVTSQDIVPQCRQRRCSRSMPAVIRTVSRRPACRARETALGSSTTKSRSAVPFCWIPPRGFSCRSAPLCRSTRLDFSIYST